jgi:DNA-binding NarL/FixJ family response regulator
MIRIALVDDHELVRTGFRMILSKEADMEIVGEGATGEDALKLARAHAIDVILMDVQMPGISGLEATERLQRTHPNTRVIAVSALDEQPVPRRLLEAGASGFLTKACPAAELVAAVRQVANGGRYLSAEIARKLALQSLPGQPGTPFEALSGRELEVALKLAEGRSLQEIARLLHLSGKTVATYKYRVFEKCGVDNVVSLAHLALRHGLIQKSAAL